MTIPRDPSRYRRWDSVLTPYTPGGAVYRVTAWGPGYAAEVRHELDTMRLISDLNFLFPAGYDLRDVRQYRGALRPLTSRIRWPENIAPLGELTEWRPDRTLDEALDRAYKLLRKWTR